MGPLPIAPMRMKPNPVVHFEMGYEDRDRMCAFYEKVFGWQTKVLGPEMGNYVLATTTESDEASGRPKQPGAINGGFYAKTADPRSHPPSIVMAVDDIRATMKAIVEHGGQTLGSMNPSGGHSDEPDTIPGVGLWISAIDTEGNRISVLQPDR